jgi:TolB protein
VAVKPFSGESSWLATARKPSTLPGLKHSADSQLTTSGAQNTGPRWSFDGDRIVYSNADSGGIEIWIMNANGTNKTRVTTSPNLDFSPSIAPDGETVFWYQNQGGNFEIMSKKLGSVAETNLTVNAAVDYAPRPTQ